jgi:hypothetical protein
MIASTDGIGAGDARRGAAWRPMLMALSLLCCAAFALRAQHRAPGDSTAMELGIARYNAYRLEDAREQFSRVVAAEPRNALALSYLAATHKYLAMSAENGETLPDYTPVRDLCLRAIAIDSCQTFALSILADLYYPQYAMLPEADYDSATVWAVRGLRCPDPEPGLLLTLLHEAWRRDRPEQELDACRRLLASGFLSPSILEYYRVLLRVLPPRALVFTGGGLDTYPLVVLQRTEHLRADVTVANVPMLNLPYYAARVCRRAGLPQPMTEREMEAYRPATDPPRFLGEHFVELLLDTLAAQSAAPPVIALNSVARDDLGVFVRGSWEPLDYGLFIAYMPPGSAPERDSAVWRAVLSDMRGERFRDPAISPRDKSAIRQSGFTYAPQYTLCFTGLQYAQEECSAGRTARAADIITQVAAFREAIPWPDEVRRELEEATLRVEEYLSRTMEE